ncbi:MAG: hypothetical protein A2004_00250 [Spirochaetes bacterium GWC1_61_12]|nr:MAG: hypothetical protein A2004_00250 [Spirochaetes bacterium GWC1_61_12]
MTSEVLSRPDRKRLEVTRRITEAAAALFIERGASSVSMDEVAVRADVARRTLFNYFESKDALLFAVAAPVLEEAVRLVRLAMAGETVGLGSVFGVCYTLHATFGGRLRLLYAFELAESDRLAALHTEYMVAFAALVERAVGAGQARLVGRLIYRNFVPLLQALEREPDGERRFMAGMQGLVAGVLAG